MHHKTHAQKSRSETRLPPEEDPEFQIAPMIDILLVLLVFFMSISSTEVLQTNDAVRLPVAKDAKDKKGGMTADGQLIVNVLWSELSAGSGGGAGAGTIDIDGKTYAEAAQITPLLAAKVQATPDFRVLIRADRKVRYEYLRSVLKAAGGAGIANVTFSVTDKEGGAAPAAAQ